MKIVETEKREESRLERIDVTKALAGANRVFSLSLSVSLPLSRSMTDTSITVDDEICFLEVSHR